MSTAEKDSFLLLSAARRGQITLVTSLIEHQGYDVDHEGDEGYTALHVAVRKRRIEMIRYLVASGANVCHKNIFEESPWSLAVEMNDIEIKEALMGRQLV